MGGGISFLAWLMLSSMQGNMADVRAMSDQPHRIPLEMMRSYLQQYIRYLDSVVGLKV